MGVSDKLDQVSAVVLGASGYAGAELLRILDRHPGIQVVLAAAETRAGKDISEIYPSLMSFRGVEFVTADEALGVAPDLVFSSLPHGNSMELFGSWKGKVVDLAGDFRLKDAGLYPAWYGKPHTAPEQLDSWIYGLTELHREEIKGADRVANPGCYPAASVLALAPFLKAGVVLTEGIHIDAMSGVSGAGRAGSEGFDFSSANENVRAYKVTGHNHIAEIEQELTLAAGSKVVVSFVPHLVPMTRGIFATSTASLAGSLNAREAAELLRDSYAGEPFLRVLGIDDLPETKRLSGTNFAEVTARVDERTARLIVLSAIDNLGKGAAGQAVQNANLMLGFPETTGLEAVGMIP